MSDFVCISEDPTAVKVMTEDGKEKIIHLSEPPDDLSATQYKAFINAQWRKIERAEGHPFCSHCKYIADPFDYGEDGSMYPQPDYAHRHVKGYAYPMDEEGRGYPLNVKLCQGHADMQESPCGDFYYEIKEEKKIIIKGQQQ